jgi:hypothetical protein
MKSTESAQGGNSPATAVDGPASKMQEISAWVDGLIELALGFMRTWALLFVQRRSLSPAMTSSRARVLLPPMTFLVLSAGLLGVQCARRMRMTPMMSACIR